MVHANENDEGLTEKKEFDFFPLKSMHVFFLKLLYDKPQKILESIKFGLVIIKIKL